ncbi:MAG: electron transfer flavoprotein subunit alpha/FixB family protein [Desulfobacterales bacterium]|jgi:electron transfer flavoprotein alpha subunit
MDKVGILIELNGGKIKKTNFGVITLARRQECELFALILNADAAACKEQLQQYGIGKIIDVTSAEGTMQWNPDQWARAIIAAMNHFGITTVCGLTSARGKDVLPRVAAYLDVPLVMDCIDLNLNERTVQKSQFSGKTIATINVSGSHFIFGIRPNAIEAKPDAREAEVVSFQADVESKGLVVKEMKQQAHSGIDLTEADIIISGGRGMEKPENFEILFECARVVGAAVGASRAAVDAGWAPHTMQVGQTGATVSPKVYIACGISGSVQHFAGMKTSGLIIAVNTDPEASITKNCDYYIAADLFEIVPILTRQLRRIVDENQMS